MKTDGRLVTLIVPAYNIEGYIGACVESILGQTYRHFELLVVDDGSTDQTRGILKGYADKDERVRVITQQNRGVSAARNAAMEMARGEYAAFVDGDDWLEPDFLQVCVDAMDKWNADMVWSGCRPHTNGRPLHLHQPHLFRWGEFSADLACTRVLSCDNYYGAVWAKMFRLSFIRENAIAFREDIRVAEDVLFLMDCIAHARRCFYLERSLYNYRCNRPGSTHDTACDSKKEDRLADRVVVYGELIDRKEAEGAVWRDRCTAMFVREYADWHCRGTDGHSDKAHRARKKALQNLGVFLRQPVYGRKTKAATVLKLFFPRTARWMRSHIKLKRGEGDVCA